MIKISKSALALSVSVFLSSCSSNKGSFESNNVQIPKVEDSISQPKNVLDTTTEKAAEKDQKEKESLSQPKTLQDLVTQERKQEELTKLMEPSMGVSMPFVRRDVFPKNNEERVMLHSENMKFSTSKENPDNIILKRQNELRNMDKSSTNQDNYQHAFEHANNWYGSRNRDNMQYVKAGWVADLQPGISFDNGKAYRGMTGFLFYQGKEPSKSLPTSKTATYKGTWDFMTNAVKGRSSEEFDTQYMANAGDGYSAFSYHESVKDDITWRKEGRDGEVSHSSEFTVDFDNKSLMGSLYRNKSKAEKTKRYDITAHLHGNRFRGDAKAVQSDDAFFGSNSKALEGGFFGPNAEELAGKFLADDNSLFAVFGAKQKSENTTEKRFDAWKFNLEDRQTEDMDTFGNAGRLVIDGRSLSLLPEAGKNRREHQLAEDKKLVINACCSNLDYTKFGNYFNEDKTASKSDAYLFLTGERTPVAQIATAGNYQYQGTWEADVLTAGNYKGSVVPNLNRESGSRAEFEVNFGNKTVKGSLYQENGTSPVIAIKDGSIIENGFTAKFESSSKGFILDSTTSGSANFNGNVKGAFYGPNASEMGGYFNSNDSDKDQIIGVFGAKQQELR